MVTLLHRDWPQTRSQAKPAPEWAASTYFHERLRGSCELLPSMPPNTLASPARSSQGAGATAATSDDGGAQRTVAVAPSVATYGITIFFGSTTRSNSDSLTMPSFNAAAFSVRSLSMA